MLFRSNPLPVHGMLAELGGRNGFESAGTHVKGQRELFNPFFLQRSQYVIGEMQSGCGRGHRSVLARIGCLIIDLIGLSGCPLNIGGQGNSSG